mmetsp:Transcript_17085/g.48841  ORF Transcript_17085/g.48841 Transcript_17085/m.48841 type:complete len:204 (+) Transcript_17085:2063-2674(+)
MGSESWAQALGRASALSVQAVGVGSALSAEAVGIGPGLRGAALRTRQVWTAPPDRRMAVFEKLPSFPAACSSKESGAQPGLSDRRLRCKPPYIQPRLGPSRSTQDPCNTQKSCNHGQTRSSSGPSLQAVSAHTTSECGKRADPPSRCRAYSLVCKPPNSRSSHSTCGLGHSNTECSCNPHSSLCTLGERPALVRHTLARPARW